MRSRLMSLEPHPPQRSTSASTARATLRRVGGRWTAQLSTWWIMTCVLWLIEGVRYLDGGQDHLGIGLWVLWGLMGVVSLALICAGTIMWELTRRSWPESTRLSRGRSLYAALWLGVGGALVVLATQWGIGWANARFRQALYRELFAGLTAACVAALSFIILPACYRAGLALVGGLTRRSVAEIPHASSSLVSHARHPLIKSSLRLIWLVGTFVICWASPDIIRVMIKALETVDLRAPQLLSVGLWSALILAPWWFSRGGHHSEERDASAGLSTSRDVRRLRSGMTLVGGMSLVMMTSGLIQGSRLTPEVAWRLSRDSAFASQLIRAAQRLTDDDRDGASDRWGGGDCDDRDAKRFPDAVEPNARRDLNCNGFKSGARQWGWLGAETRSQQAVHGPPEGALQQARAPRHLILLTVDALRYDTYLQHMPKTRAFAQKSVDFSSAYSAGAATYWSIPALLGSRPPSFFKMGRDQTPVKRERLLTEALKDQGFHTGLFANVTIFFVRGLSQGAITKNYRTSRYTVHGAKPGARHLTDSLIKHIDAWRAKKLKPQRRRLFAWAHYYDPHDPYFEVPGFPAHSSEAQHRYEAIVRSVDAELGRLFQALNERGMLEDTAIVLTADHGDEFGDHGHRFHGRTLYDEMVRVPLIMYSPAYPPQAVDQVISHIDVAPTLLSHLGLKGESRFLGRDWDAELRRGRAVNRSEAFFEVLPDSNYGIHLVGMRYQNEKLIYHVQSGALERFMLDRDPMESMNLTRRTQRGDHRSTPSTQRLMGYLEAHLRQLSRRESGARFPRRGP